jgi:hypothetical protein
MDNNAILTEEITGDQTVSGILMAGNRKCGNDIKPKDEEEDDGDDEIVITVTEASNMVQRLQHLVMTKKYVLD